MSYALLREYRYNQCMNQDWRWKDVLNAGPIDGFDIIFHGLGEWEPVGIIRRIPGICHHTCGGYPVCVPAVYREKGKQEAVRTRASLDLSGRCHWRIYHCV